MRIITPLRLPVGELVTCSVSIVWENVYSSLICGDRHSLSKTWSSMGINVIQAFVKGKDCSVIKVVPATSFSPTKNCRMSYFTSKQAVPTDGTGLYFLWYSLTLEKVQYQALTERIVGIYGWMSFDFSGLKAQCKHQKQRLGEIAFPFMNFCIL